MKSEEQVVPVCCTDMATVLVLLRVTRGWNQSQLVEASGVGHSSVSEFERRKRTPSMPTLQRLLNAMGYSFAALGVVDTFVAQLRFPKAADDRPVGKRDLATEVGRVASRLTLALLDLAESNLG